MYGALQGRVRSYVAARNQACTVNVPKSSNSTVSSSKAATEPLADYAPALVHLAECADVSITNCRITGSAKIGLALDRCGGRIERTTVTHAREAGIRALESTGLAISGNTVSDCGNGGILVWRWSAGEDGTIVTGNRVERIAREQWRHG